MLGSEVVLRRRFWGEVSQRLCRHTRRRGRVQFSRWVASWCVVLRVTAAGSGRREWCGIEDGLLNNPVGERMYDSRVDNVEMEILQTGLRVVSQVVCLPAVVRLLRRQARRTKIARSLREQTRSKGQTE